MTPGHFRFGLVPVKEKTCLCKDNSTDQVHAVKVNRTAVTETDAQQD